MKYILNTLAAIVFGLLVSVEYVGAAPTQERPAHVGNLSPMLSNICVGNANLQAEECIKRCGTNDEVCPGYRTLRS